MRGKTKSPARAKRKQVAPRGAKISTGQDPLTGARRVAAAPTGFPPPHLADDDKVGTALQKAVRLLRALVASDTPKQLSDLAEAVAMPRPSVHRLIMQLEDVGMVQRDVSGRGYTVGHSWLWLAIDALGVVARRPPIRDIMRALVERVGESCNLAILVDHEVLYLERVECDWPLRMQLHAGSRVPQHCTASGKLLLAHLSGGQRRRILRSLRLERHTSNTITDPLELDAECGRILRSGISINREEYHLGLIGVAVPVVRRDGKVIAALAIHAPVFRMNVEGARANVNLLQAAAAEIARELGPNGLAGNDDIRTAPKIARVKSPENGNSGA